MVRISVRVRVNVRAVRVTLRYNYCQYIPGSNVVFCAAFGKIQMELGERCLLEWWYSVLTF